MVPDKLITTTYSGTVSELVDELELTPLYVVALSSSVH